jgi:glycosyltransferase involved in cell wall biosynthesis
MLKMGLNVKFLPANFFPHQPYTHALQQMGVEVLVGEEYARNWKQWFKKNASSIQIVYLHRPHIAEEFIDYLASFGAAFKLVYFGHDLHYLRIEREAHLSSDKKLLKESKEWKKREFKIFEKVDVVLYPSQVEVASVKNELPNLNVSQLPLYTLEQPESESFKTESRLGLLFVGGFGHPPNVDAMKWFVEDVLPKLGKEFDNVKLHIVGSNTPDEIFKLASHRVIVHGFLSDEELRDLYQTVRLVVVPLRFGAGVKGKVLEAIQAGLPIITTSIGAEGIPEAEQIMVISDEAEDMAGKISLLYKDEDLINHYLSTYPQFIDKYFSHKTIQSVIEKEFLN